ncbi:cytochrome c [Vibrio clamense]|uniref:c-type cytochrome n=1 Tax=Vibrio TaxID=662 RepID=UPI0010BD5575|nr:cytochrome c [Vibrio genomosp. F6]TKF22005.1 cytochrome c [Vibrio genomosp. F6]
MKKLTIALLVTLPAFANAQSSQNIIDTRQHSFSSIENKTEQLEEVLDKDKPDWTEVVTISEELTHHSTQLRALFPEGSSEGSKAKGTIWEKPEKFNKLMMEMDQGFKDLYQASKNQDLNSAQNGLEQAQDTCNSCHRSYRSRW